MAERTIVDTLYAALDDVNSQNATLRQLLREHVIQRRSGDDETDELEYCGECWEAWKPGEPERHKQDCRYAAAMGGVEDGVSST